MIHQPSSIDDIIDAMSAREPPPRVLLAEDDSQLREKLSAALRADGYDVIEAGSGVQLIRALDLFGADILPLEMIITDARMPGFSGLEVLEYLRYTGWNIPVIVITAPGDVRTHTEASDLDATMVLEVPFEMEELRTALVVTVPPPTLRRMDAA